MDEEVIDDVGRFSTPTGSRSSSPSGVDKRSQTPAQSALQEPTYYAEIATDGQSVTRISDPAELATSCRIPQLQTDSVQKTPVATTTVQRQISIVSALLLGFILRLINSCTCS